MVKGVSRQVIVLQSPDPELFEQAIFILKNSAVNKGVSDEMLMREARRLVKGGRYESGKCKSTSELIWTLTGAAFTGFLWLLFALI